MVQPGNLNVNTPEGAALAEPDSMSGEAIDPNVNILAYLEGVEVGMGMVWDLTSPKTCETGQWAQHTLALLRVTATWSLSEGEGMPSCCFKSGGAVPPSMEDAWPEVTCQSESMAMSLFMFERVMAGGIANTAQVVVSVALR
jgi:hypothetical protein